MQKIGGKKDQLVDPKHPQTDGAEATNPKELIIDNNTGNKKSEEAGKNEEIGPREDGSRKERNIFRTEGRHARGKEK